MGYSIADNIAYCTYRQLLVELEEQQEGTMFAQCIRQWCMSMVETFANFQDIVTGMRVDLGLEDTHECDLFLLWTLRNGEMSACVYEDAFLSTSQTL